MISHTAHHKTRRRLICALPDTSEHLISRAECPENCPDCSRFAVASQAQDFASTLGPERRSRAYYARGEESYGPGARRDSHVHPAQSSGHPYYGPLQDIDLHNQPTPRHSSIGHTYRYEPIIFQLDGFPEVGAKVVTLANGQCPSVTRGNGLHLQGGC